ncbi:MAG: response regulator [Phycisphaerales bacterium]|nr:response regulator [Phycisphaerales bacterium]
MRYLSICAAAVLLAALVLHFGLRMVEPAASLSSSWSGSGAMLRPSSVTWLIMRDVMLVVGVIFSALVLLLVSRPTSKHGEHHRGEGRTEGRSEDHAKHSSEGLGATEPTGEAQRLTIKLIDTDVHTDESLAWHREHLELARRESVQARLAATEFLASMSHEIRTPMTAILGFAELLADDQGRPTSPAIHADAIRTIRKQGTHLLGVINGVLDLAKIESGQMQVESNPCSPMQLVDDVELLFGARASAMGIRLIVECQYPLPDTVLSDALRIRQVLVNLVGNALKFTPPPPLSPGRVVLRVSTSRASNGASSLVFECSDTGCGISDELAERIFKPFSQSDASTAREFGGSGLGLSICQRFAQLLGGSMSLRRHHDGPGTTFVLTIPIRETSTTRWMTEPAPAVKAEPVGNRVEAMNTLPNLAGRVLVVEDAPDNQRLIAHFLTKAGASVEIASNGRVALSMVGASGGRARYDLVLMDMQMPELDGYGAATELRSAGFDGPIIALTANALDGDRQRCLDAGCNDYLSKPVDRRKLIELCAMWMPQARALSGGAASGAAASEPQPA